MPSTSTCASWYTAKDVIEIVCSCSQKRLQLRFSGSGDGRVVRMNQTAFDSYMSGESVAIFAESGDVAMTISLPGKRKSPPLQAAAGHWPSASSVSVLVNLRQDLGVPCPVSCAHCRIRDGGINDVPRRLGLLPAHCQWVTLFHRPLPRPATNL